MIRINEFLWKLQRESHIWLETSEKDEQKQCPSRWVSRMGRLSQTNIRYGTRPLRYQLY